jgi:hypothetical protein
MGRADSSRQIDPAHNGTYFLSNQNAELVRLCERKMSNYPHYRVRVMNNRFYISKNDTKPLRNEGKIYIFSTEEPDPVKVTAPVTTEVQAKY